MKWVALSDIIISEPFASSKPRISKLTKVRNYYLEYGGIDKPIIVNQKNILLDGYIRYLVLKENGAMYTKAKVVNYIPRKRKEI